jgi:hypothetical protein
MAMGILELAQTYGLSWAELAGFGTFAAASVALLVGAATVSQKSAADKRDQWWKRTQWALDMSSDADNDAAQSVGLATLQALLEEEEATPADAALLRRAMSSLLELRDRAALEE